MKVLYLGNEFVQEDSLAKRISKKLLEEFTQVKFIEINDTFQLLEHLQEKNVIILDVVKDLKEVKEISVSELKKKNLISLHDFDAGFFMQLINYNPKIIGIPCCGDIEKITKEIRRFLKSYENL